ncbi:hypothetical protein SynBIOSU31_01831 [Synechococcus sp. BIOS-U3-1]|nr:hypothetical protein SynBIOSU31_01831 [Synechococcus sp. BIOS-U3-1]
MSYINREVGDFLLTAFLASKASFSNCRCCTDAGNELAVSLAQDRPEASPEPPAAVLPISSCDNRTNP